MIPYNPISLPNVIKDLSNPNNPAPFISAKQANPAHGKISYTTLYFGYASNLSWQIMKGRCPDSLFTGLARLDGWRWVINSSRYANIVKSPGDVVYGSLCFLSNRDEDALDTSEGVPTEYQKLYLPVVRLNNDGSEMMKDGKPHVVEALAYVDHNRVEIDGTIEPDYVVLINKAIVDGVAYGMPQEYADKYLRPYTPLPEPWQQITMVRTLKQLDLRQPEAPTGH